MELKDIEALFNAKIDPIKETIERLERQQERIVEIVSNQAVMMNTIKHIESTIDNKIEEADKIHSTLFTRMRELEDSSTSKIWDIVKLIFAAIVGGIAAHLGWHK